MTPYQQKQIDLMRQMELSLASDPTVSTTVPIQTDYANDTQMCLTCISFIPKDIAKTIQTQLINPLAALEPNFYYYPAESLHVTIQNIRVIHDPPHFDLSDIRNAKMVFSDTISAYGPFTFDYQGLLSMPTSVSVIALVTPEFNTCVRHIRQQLIAAHVPDDKKYFSDTIVFANTTICRYTHRPSAIFLETLKNFKDIRIGSFVAKDVALVETNAGAYPSKTTILETYRFNQI